MLFECLTRKSQRLRNYDYSQAGAYFVTICSYQKNCMFGYVKDDSAQPNRLGEVIVGTWQKLEAIYPFVSLYSFVIMPNHFHAIIWIDENISGKSVSTIIGHFKARSTHEARRIFGE